MKKHIQCNRLAARSLTMLAIAIGVSAGWSSVHAQVRTYDLTLTENSSTSLSLSYTGPTGDSGFTVLNTSPDHWTIQINSSNLVFDSFSYDWAEPEDVNNINEVQHSTTINPDAIFAISDLNLLMDQGGPVLANNTAAPLFVGHETDGQFTTGFILLTFKDLAAANETAVPDTGSSLALLGLSCIALMVASRFRLLRSA